MDRLVALEQGPRDMTVEADSGPLDKMVADKPVVEDSLFGTDMNNQTGEPPLVVLHQPGEDSMIDQEKAAPLAGHWFQKDCLLLPC